MIIYCCNCNKAIIGRLTNGKEIYPHRKDLYKLPFWKCDCCNQFVGCHHKSNEPTMPLGCIPSPEIKYARQIIHTQLDIMWENKEQRTAIYTYLSKMLGYTYHTADIKHMGEIDRVLYLLNEY